MTPRCFSLLPVLGQQALPAHFKGIRRRPLSPPPCHQPGSRHGLPGGAHCLSSPLQPAPHRRQREPVSRPVRPCPASAQPCPQLPQDPANSKAVSALEELGSDTHDAGQASQVHTPEAVGYQSSLESRQERTLSPWGAGFKIRLVLAGGTSEDLKCQADGGDLTCPSTVRSRRGREQVRGGAGLSVDSPLRPPGDGWREYTGRWEVGEEAGVRVGGGPRRTPELQPSQGDRGERTRQREAGTGRSQTGDLWAGGTGAEVTTWLGGRWGCP